MCIRDRLQILGDDTATVAARELGTDNVLRPITCDAADLVPAVDGYWTVLAIMAERLVAGEFPVSI